MVLTGKTISYKCFLTSESCKGLWDIKYFASIFLLLFKER